MDEKELIALCQRGDLKAFETLVGFYQRQVQAMAQRILGDRDEACDAAQDAFAQAFFNIHMYDSNRSFRAWLFGITIKRCLDRLRRRKSYIHFVQQYSGFIKLWQEKDPREDARAAMDSLMRFLPEKERITVSLQIGEGLSIPEIAAIMGCSASTVRVHLFNARKRLKKELRQDV